MMDLIPYTKYEFRLKGFIGATPSAYSDSVIVKTLETVPDKIDNLHGYVWNDTSVVVHWTPPNSTNGPNFVRKILIMKMIYVVITVSKTSKSSL
jgi:hypothetical protein